MTDIYNDNIALLLHCDGVNDSTTFTDTGRNALAITNTANRTKVKTAQSQFGGASADFAATRDNSLTTASSTGLQLAANNFTLEGWARVRPGALGAAQLPILVTRTGNENAGIWIVLGGTFEWKVGNAGWIVNMSTSLPTADTWFHWALVRNGSIFTAYIDGAQVATTTQTVSVPTAHDSFGIGTDRYLGNCFDGYLDEVRITNGVARYTAAFTPPTEAFENYTPNAGNVAVNMPMPFTTGYGAGIGASIALPSVTALGYSGGSGNALMPSMTVYALGQTSSYNNTLEYTMPLSCVGYGGANASESLPIMLATATGTGTNWGHADDLACPQFTLAASGTITEVGSADLTIGAFTLIGYSGAVCSVTLNDGYTFAATGTNGSVGSADITLPLFELTATGTQQNYGSADLLMPAIQIVATAQAWLALPGFTLTAIGSATIAATYEAYALNLKHKPRGPGEPDVDEMTRYTNFPFTHVVRYKNSYYGANSTGLYLLEGTTDDGDPIPYAVETAKTDFKQVAKKTLVSAYFGGSIGPAETITLIAGDTTPLTYDYTTPRGPYVQNYRQVFGRGVKARYYALGVSGSAEFSLDTLDLEVDQLTRRI